jgi:hypothetical protein
MVSDPNDYLTPITAGANYLSLSSRSFFTISPQFFGNIRGARRIATHANPKYIQKYSNINSLKESKTKASEKDTKPTNHIELKIISAIFAFFISIPSIFSPWLL